MAKSTKKPAAPKAKINTAKAAVAPKEKPAAAPKEKSKNELSDDAIQELHFESLQSHINDENKGKKNKVKISEGVPEGFQQLG